MATIRTTLQMFDGVSPALRSMTNALNICISSFESMQTAANSSVDNSGFQAAREELARTEAAVGRLEQEFRQVDQAVRQSDHSQQAFNSDIRQGSVNVGSLVSKVMALVSAVATFASVKKVFEISDTFVSSKARLDLIIDKGSTTEALQKKIYESAGNSRGNVMDVTGSVSKLGLLSGDAFKNNDEIIMFTEQMNKQFKIGGASISEQTNAMYQLTQAMAAGRLQGDEFRSIMENAPMLAQSIAEHMGASVGELRAMSSEGLITAEVIKNSLFSAAEETNAKFATLPLTWADIGTGIKNVAVNSFESLLLMINDVANSPAVELLKTKFENTFNKIAIFSDQFAGAFKKGIDVVSGGLTGIGKGAEFVGKHMNILLPIVTGVIAAKVLYKSTLLALTVAQTAYNAKQVIATTLELARTNGLKMAIGSLIAKTTTTAAATAATSAEVAATVAATAAQVGFNAALYACPIMAIIGGLSLLVVAIVKLSNSLSESEKAAKQWADSLINRIEQVKQTADETFAQDMAPSTKANFLVDEFQSLATMKTPEAFARMHDIVSELNSTIPNLNMSTSFDNTTASVYRVSAAIKQVNQDFMKFSEAQANANAYKSIFEENAKAVAEANLKMQKEGAKLLAAGLNPDDFFLVNGNVMTNNDNEWEKALEEDAASMASYLKAQDLVVPIKANMELAKQSMLDAIKEVSSFGDQFIQQNNDIVAAMETQRVQVSELGVDQMVAAVKARTLYNEFEILRNKSFNTAQEIDQMHGAIAQINTLIPNTNAKFNEQTRAIDGVTGSLYGAIEAFYKYAKAQAFVNAYQKRLDAQAETYIAAKETYDKFGSLANAPISVQIDASAATTVAKNELNSIDTSMQNTVNELMKYTAETQSFGDRFETSTGGGGAAKRTADNTARMADSMSASEEDLKYLRDIAEREAVNRFTTAEIKIDMGGINQTVNSNMDLDGVVSYLEEKLYETMEVAAEGVYET